MYSLPDRGIHYLAYPRTASRATGELFLSLGGKRVGGGHHGFRGLEEVQKGDIVLVTVRNHFDWFASFFNHEAERGWTFREFVKEWCSNSIWVQERLWFELVLYREYMKRATAILRYETLEEDLRRYLGDVELPQVGEQKRFAYQDMFDENLARWVGKKFRREMKQLNYTF